MVIFNFICCFYWCRKEVHIGMLERVGIVTENKAPLAKLFGSQKVSSLTFCLLIVNFIFFKIVNILWRKSLLTACLVFGGGVFSFSLLTQSVSFHLARQKIQGNIPRTAQRYMSLLKYHEIKLIHYMFKVKIY